ncbi:hypothetical protein Bbelb_116820 [Branchiostoma belcheri]|nr:hypothetical protein Bbelb_116820 [Branchiostoma belcheri]
MEKTPDTRPVNALQTKSRGRRNQNKPTQPKGSCYNCGGSWPHKGGKESCPAWGKTCLNCNKKNHLAKYCKAKQTPRSKKVHAVERDEDMSEEDYTFHVGVINGMASKGKLPSTKVTINKRKIPFLIDTGASVNILGEETYKEELKDRCSKTAAP